MAGEGDGEGRLTLPYLPATGEAQPPYTRVVAYPGGRFRRWILHLMLRATVKRMKVRGVDISVLRAEQAQMDARFGRVEADVRRTPVMCNDVPAEWIDVANSGPSRVLLYLHGGAFIFRYPQTHAGLASRFCRGLAARALMVDYRLAPEHRYPAALDDCHAAYRWLLAQGHDPRQIVIAGDSAGANLALAMLLRIKAAGEPLPACAVLISPVVDFTLSGDSLVTHGHRDPIFTLPTLISLRQYYARPEQFLDVGMSPLFGDFAGLPPLLFQVGSLEMLLDESTRGAARAHAAGVPVELEIWHDMAHVFQAQPALPQAEAAVGHVVRFIATHAGWAS